MHQLPVLHCWYHLFAPARSPHRYRIFGADAASAGRQSGDLHQLVRRLGFLPMGHLDGSLIRPQRAAGGCFGLRLPHEPEWEYAARWAPNGAGQPEPIRYGQRYWWGDEFYEAEDLPEPEPLSNELAHTIGVPGQTRAPDNAAPNGLGFLRHPGQCLGMDRQRLQDAQRGRIFPCLSAAVPRAACSQLRCTMRGGLWYYLDLLANCTARFRLYSNDRDYKMGFRVVREERSLT